MCITLQYCNILNHNPCVLICIILLIHCWLQRPVCFAPLIEYKVLNLLPVALRIKSTRQLYGTFHTHKQFNVLYIREFKKAQIKQHNNHLMGQLTLK